MEKPMSEEKKRDLADIYYELVYGDKRKVQHLIDKWGLDEPEEEFDIVNYEGDMDEY